MAPEQVLSSNDSSLRSSTPCSVNDEPSQNNTLSVTNEASYSNPTPQNEEEDEDGPLPASTADSLPLIINHGDFEECIPVPVNVYGEATIVKQDYLKLLTTPDQEKPETLPSPRSSIELVAGFLDFCIGAGSSAYHIARFVLDYFEFMYLGSSDVHVVICSLPVDEQAKIAVLRAYLNARYIIRHSVKQPSSSLFRAAEQGTITLNAIFGGQGLTKPYFDELKSLYDAYEIYLEQFITASARQLKEWSTPTQDESEQVPCPPIHLMEWLGSGVCPYDMTDPAISFPLIGLIQLARYAVICQALGLTPGQFCRRFSGFAGHSQGIVAAVALAASDSWKDFYDNAAKAIRVLCSIGLRGRQACFLPQVNDTGVRDAVAHGEGHPSPMLSVRHLTRDRLDPVISALNLHLPEYARVELALVNGPDTFVVSGPPPSLYALGRRLRALKAEPEDSQVAIPYSKRKVRFSLQFLQVAIPYHSKYLASAVDRIALDIDTLQIRSDELQIPVYGGRNGNDMRSYEGNLLPVLVRSVTCEIVHWDRASMSLASTHVIDFGPGANSGIASLTADNKRGTGARFIIAGSFLPSNADFGSVAELFTSSSQALVGSQNWLVDCAPALTRTPGRQVIISTRLSRLLGLPPFIVAGMTPTTTHWDFVAAVMNAGYHTELAGGGYHNEKEMEAAIRKISASVPPGRGITINLLYLSPVTLAWQIPLVRRLRSEGINIDGLTIGGGVPESDVVAEYIGLGVRHISFKPGSVSSILAVTAIARAYPDFPIVLQWTGGRGGGHHSNEDFHQPILHTYSRMRQYSNLILVIGSGFGEENGNDTYPYLTGSWSEKFGHVAMPVDGILYGSRMMVAKEAHTSQAAKEMIARAEGIVNAQWEETMSKPNGIGSIVSVRSEMGQPIHKLATRGTMLWAEFDRDIFSLPREKRMSALKLKRNYIIKRLNQDFQKVWFGMKDGLPADLLEMTYEEVGHRLISLMFREKTERGPARWIDNTWQTLVADFLRRSEGRFRGRTASPLHQELHWIKFLPSEPYNALNLFLDAYPQACKRLLAEGEVQYFLDLCRRRGQKPVPFVPVLDDHFETYFKKDSLWQSEDLDALIDGDVGRTCILHGPVAAQHSTPNNINQPVEDMLSRINTGVMGMLKADPFDAKKSLLPSPSKCIIPKEEYLGANVPLGVLVEHASDRIVYHIPPIKDLRLPSTAEWLHLLAGPRRSWRHCLLMTEQVVQGQLNSANPVKKLLAPRHGYWYKLMSPGHVERSSLVVLNEKENPVVEIFFQRAAGNIAHVKLLHTGGPDRNLASLTYSYEYRPDVVFAPLREVMENRNDRIKAFYRHIWLGHAEPQIKKDLPTGEDISSLEFSGERMTISRELIRRFTKATGLVYSASYACQHQQVSVDLAIVIGWKALVKPLLSDVIDGDISRLVHLSNSFTCRGEPLREGDVVDSKSRITSIIQQRNGKLVEVECDVLRGQGSAVLITSQFLIRETNVHSTGVIFQRTKVAKTHVSLTTVKDVAILRSRKFIHLETNADPRELLGNSAEFDLETTESTSLQTGIKSVSTRGTIKLVGRHVDHTLGTLSCHSIDRVNDPALGYLERHGRSSGETIRLESPIPLLSEPRQLELSSNSQQYADVSGDFNPIHTSSTFAVMCGLTDTICHGMQTSAAVHNVVQQWAGGLGYVRRYQVSFSGMLLPEEKIAVTLHHVGMISGRKLIHIEAVKSENGDVVLKGEAEVEERQSAYVFTGQGSQAVGMGMELAKVSLAATSVWDRADAYLESKFGE